MMNFFKKIFLCNFLLLSISNAFAAKPAPSKRLIDKTVAIVNQEIILLSEYEEFRKGLEAELKKSTE